MNEQQFWIAIWRTFAWAFVGTVLVIGGCTVRKNELRYEAIKAGADPIALSCMAGVQDNKQHICTLVAQRGVAK